MGKKLMMSVTVGGLLLAAACTSRPKEDTRPFSERILGTWQMREVNNGVVYRSIFHEDGLLTQQFRDHFGGGKDRPGEWEVRGDTLTIYERIGISELFIHEINDSVMLLLRGDSSALVFDRVREVPSSEPEKSE